MYKEGQLQLLEPVDLTEGQIVDVIIQSESQQVDLTPEQVDARLRSAGVLLEAGHMEDAVELLPEERRRIGALFAGERPSEDLIDEDRGPY